ncbi:MAG: hydrogenase small subunit [Bacillota bacterium]|nr:hydrogenase small subunit [Bacillota bacterium]
MSREFFWQMDRRDFLKLCGGVAAALGLSEVSVPKIAEVLAASAAKPPVIWLELGSCTGDSCSFLNADSPTAAEVILNQLSVRYHEAIMAAQGTLAEKAIEDTIKNEAGKYVVVVEGVVPTKKGYGMIGGKEMQDILKEVSANALVVIALGTCSAYGGIPGGDPNPGEVKPVMDLIDRNKVINLPGCPAHPMWLLSTVTHLLMFGMPKLDSQRRPVAIYGQTIHDNCPRRSAFDEGRYVEQFGQAEVDRDYCLIKKGCKGPITYSNCPQQRWNSGKNWCIGAGAPCIGCVDPKFPDAMSPFYDRLPDIGIPGVAGLRTDADTVGAVVGAATAIGIAAHAVGAAAKGKLGRADEAEKKSGKASRA